MPIEEFNEKDFETDHFTVLELDFGASDEEVKKAYKRLALQLHPDKCDHAMANDAMQALNVAYDKITIPPKPKQQAAYGRPGAKRPGARR